MKAEPLGSTVSSLSEAPLYEAAKKAHEERRAVFQAVADRAADLPGPMHKWKRCTDCGHEQHSMRCFEPVSDTSNCGCLKLTAARDIATTCRRAGGCPEHPVTVQLRQERDNAALDAADDLNNEPPLTPEEEEAFGECPGWPECPAPGSCPACTLPEGDPVPIQPVRRPPYAVAYSVDGALYEVALPGDATVTAVDGHLVIKHSFGQVAGIVGIHPIEHKEAS